jgi:hypothetical protein
LFIFLVARPVGGASVGAARPGEATPLAEGLLKGNTLGLGCSSGRTSGRLLHCCLNAANWHLLGIDCSSLQVSTLRHPAATFLPTRL